MEGYQARIPMVAIEWSPVADLQLLENLKYAQIMFGRKTTQRWADSIASIEKRLRMAPESYPLEPLLLSNPRQYRGALLMRNFRLIHYYDKSRNVVRIMRIWDSRMNPQRLIEDLQ